MAAADLGSAEWERSKISTQDINLLKKLGISKKPKALCFPSEESYPTPPMGYRVSFVDHLIRGLSAPIHPFLRGLLFIYGLQLHHLTPNSILHISIFITLCEAFLGVQPNWALWKRIFFCRRNGSPNVAYNIGGVVISVRPTVDYFDVCFLTPFKGGARNEKLAEANERANILAQKLEQSEEARKKAESDAIEARAEADKAKTDAAGVEDLRKRLHDAETSLSEHIAAQSAREEAVLKRIRTQNRRFVNRTAQEFELEDPDNDPLLDAVSFLEFHGTEAREGIDQAKAGLSRLFPYFFPKKEEPATFLNLAKCFNPPEDLGLKMRQENMKVAVENTVALVADSQQTIDWAKVGDTEQIEQQKWRSLIKAAKPNMKKILSYLGIKPSSTPSSSKPEV
ncbi:hypothetical protein QYE76_036620 [Lolium multiflorum]|uniref:Transposase (putative) gypsy type domain-containing protein n=1 Tax=Lolium multiflorum TaxID=4521 RepID=A0AAD8VM78_LOLMU|nr:hypothetical protein QYE76_036620 [Lolium multiflorum]